MVQTFNYIYVFKKYLGDVTIGLHIYIYVQYWMAVHKNITQKLRYTKKKHCCCKDMYVCMYRIPLRHTSFPMLGLGLVGAALISCSTFVVVASVTLPFRNACTRKLFVIVLVDSLLSVILNAIYSLSIVFMVFSCFTFLELLCLCSDVGHDFVQGRGVFERRACRF